MCYQSAEESTIPDNRKEIAKLTLIEHSLKATAIRSNQNTKALAESIYPFAFVLLSGHCLDPTLTVLLPVREVSLVQISLGILYACVSWNRKQSEGKRKL